VVFACVCFLVPFIQMFSVWIWAFELRQAYEDSVRESSLFSLSVLTFFAAGLTFVFLTLYILQFVDKVVHINNEISSVDERRKELKRYIISELLVDDEIFCTRAGTITLVRSIFEVIVVVLAYASIGFLGDESFESWLFVVLLSGMSFSVLWAYFISRRVVFHFHPTKESRAVAEAKTFTIGLFVIIAVPLFIGQIILANQKYKRAF